MNGNNSQTKEQFLASLGNPRKVELANILFSDDENKADTALEAGFNIVILQEMARDIRSSVVDHETFTVQGNGAVKKAEAIENPQVDQTPTDQTPEDSTVVDESITTETTQTTETNEPENTPVESTDSVDQVDPATAEVANEEVVDPVAEQSTPDQATPQS